VVSACASSNNAIGESFEMIRAGRLPVIVSGGCEAAINEFAVAAFANMGATSTRNDEPTKASRPFDKNRDGFVSGEGAAVLVLESLESAQARGAHIYAEMIGYGTSADAHHITAPDPNGAQYAMRMALRQAGILPNQVDYLNAHGTSTPLNDSSETKAIKMVFGEDAYKVNVSSTKSMTGHLLGAAGAVEALACVKAINTGLIPPTINYETPDPECDLNYTPNIAARKDVRIAMSNSFGFGGHNAVIVLRRFE
jgi:3-oxoacyl-[acyl-carrier-protein] synthase II